MTAHGHTQYAASSERGPGAGSRSWFSRALRALDRVGVCLVIAAVYAYRLTLGWLLGGRCRFIPSCSEYCLQAVKRYGTVRGLAKTVRRLSRCHPFHPGGVDPP